MKERSDCCNAPVTTSHIFTGHGEIPDDVVTMYYICLSCKEACDIREMEIKEYPVK